MAIYPYIVNLNGTWYPAGTVVPDSNSEKEITTNEAVVSEKESVKRRSKKNKAAEE